MVKKTARKERLEIEIQREILDWLDEQKVFLFWRSNNIPVYGRSNDGQKRFRALPKYTPKGLPDITIIYKGVPVFLEVKRNSTTPLSLEQRDMGARIKRAGGVYHRVWSLLQTICYLEELGYDSKNIATPELSNS